MLLDRARRADGVTERVEAPLVGHGLAVQEPPYQGHGLGQPVQPFPDAAPEVEPECLVLALEPAGADAQDRAAAGDVVDRDRHLGREAGVAEGVGGDHVAEPRPPGDRADRGQRGPALELGVRPVSLVGQQVVVDPQVVEPGGLGVQDRIAQLRPARPLDPERRPEPHGHASPPRSLS